MDVGSPADGADGAVGSRVHPNVEREERGGPRTPPPLPVGPDLPVERPGLGARAVRVLRGRWDILAVIAGGGAVGSAARYGLAEAVPHEPGQVAWSTAVVNVAGGFVLGALMVFVVDVWPPTRYVRPFLGVGVLGGFTTFSTYMLDTRAMLTAGRPFGAAGYLVGTLLVGLVAVWLGIVTARTLSRTRPPARGEPEHDHDPGTSDDSTKRSPS